jgi:hypothetical protein
MADYYPLISRAVSGLDKNTGENRRVLYERARAALVNQLRGVEPALEEADITRERLALEEAIRKVEAEAVRLAMPEPAEPARSEADKPPPSLRDRGLSDFRNSVAKVEELGGAASGANRAAREVLQAMPGDRPPPAAERAPAGAATHYFEPPGESAPAEHAPEARAQAPRAEPVEPAEVMPPPAYAEPTALPTRSRGRLITILVLILVLAGLAGAGYWQRHAITTMVASWRTHPPAVKPAAAPAPAVKPKIADRVQPAPRAEAPTKPANAPTATVAQKVVLYEEVPGNPQGKRYVGSAIWRTETVSPGPGLAPELAVRADVDIPERHMRMTWSLRRNTDKDLPASHTIEIMFTLPADFDQGSIGNVPGVLMKDSEQARGIPLAGLAVKVTNGYFLIGLSAVDVDKQRNIALLKDRDWFDIPIVYTSGKRAILAMEKGPAGQRAFAEAFRAWGE